MKFKRFVSKGGFGRGQGGGTKDKDDYLHDRKTSWVEF